MTVLLRRLKRWLRYVFFRVVFWAYKALFWSIAHTDEKYIVESVRRKQWFYRSRFPVFEQHHFVGDIPAVTHEDIAVADEVKRYWHSLLDSAPSGQTVWSTDLQGADGLIAVLNSGDVESIARALSGMFHSSYIRGISHGFRHRELPSSRLLVPIAVEDRLVSLAEYLGVVPAETIEQGVCGVAMRDGLEALVEKIERALQFEMAFPVGLGASGIKVGSRVITQRQVEHIYMACRLHAWVQNVARIDEPFEVTEVGAGYGGLCLWVQRMFKTQIQKYYVVDLPWVNVFQAFFLKKALGTQNVAFYSDDPEKRRLAKIVIYSSECDASVLSDAFGSQVFINQDSFPEMPASAANQYLAWITSRIGALLFTYQQENGYAVRGVAQNNVHELLQGFPTAKLRSRNLSWTRDGYTEEIYEMT